MFTREVIWTEQAGFGMLKDGTKYSVGAKIMTFFDTKLNVKNDITFAPT